MSDVPRISPAEAYAKVTGEGYTYVDVRAEDEFEEGHPAGALNVPLLVRGPAGLEPNPEFLGVMERLFARDAPIVVGCQKGGRSLRAARALVAAGFTRVVDQRAGWDGVRGTFGEVLEPGWARAGLPSATGTPAGCTYAEVKERARR